MDVTLRAIVHAALLTPSPLERYRPAPARRARDGPLALVATGVPRPDFNQVLVLGPVALPHLFATATAFFHPAEAYSIAVELEAAPTVDAELRAAGWRLDEEEPALVLPALPATAPPLPVGLTVRLVSSEAELADFRSVHGGGDSVVPSLAATQDADVALLVGYAGDEPVATARLGCLGEVAEINGVATLPAQRRRGYGMALTWAAVQEGAARGCSAAMLTASAMGYPLYLRMGFVPVCTLRTYLPPE